MKGTGLAAHEMTLQGLLQKTASVVGKWSAFGGVSVPPPFDSKGFGLNCAVLITRRVRRE